MRTCVEIDDFEGPVRAVERRARAVDQEDQRVGHFGPRAGRAGESAATDPRGVVCCVVV